MKKTPANTAYLKMHLLFFILLVFLITLTLITKTDAQNPLNPSDSYTGRLQENVVYENAYIKKSAFAVGNDVTLWLNVPNRSIDATILYIDDSSLVIGFDYEPFKLIVLFQNISKIVVYGPAIITEYLVKVKLTSGRLIKGILKSLNDSSVQVLGKGEHYSSIWGMQYHPDSTKGNFCLKVSEIQTIKYRRLNAARRGFGIGAITGGLIGYGVGANNSEDILAVNVDFFNVGFVVGSLLGGGLGAVLGSATNKVAINGQHSRYVLFRSWLLKNQ
jgi:hypothetical protein